PARGADRGLPRAVREPVHGGRAWLRRRGDRAAAHEARLDRRARDGADEARAETAAQTRKYSPLAAEGWFICRPSPSVRGPVRGQTPAVSFRRRARAPRARPESSRRLPL